MAADPCQHPGCAGAAPICCDRDVRLWNGALPLHPPTVLPPVAAPLPGQPPGTQEMGPRALVPAIQRQQPQEGAPAPPPARNPPTASARIPLPLELNYPAIQPDQEIEYQNINTPRMTPEEYTLQAAQLHAWAEEAAAKRAASAAAARSRAEALAEEVENGKDRPALRVIPPEQPFYPPSRLVIPPKAQQPQQEGTGPQAATHTLNIRQAPPRPTQRPPPSPWAGGGSFAPPPPPIRASAEAAEPALPSGEINHRFPVWSKCELCNDKPAVVHCEHMGGVKCCRLCLDEGFAAETQGRR